MAADSQEPQGKRKRKRPEINRRKLVSDEKVEVRSLEDGFLGSWHTGTVICCQELSRVVRYDHLLSDDGSDSLVERVDVIPAIEGIAPNGTGKPGDHRGVIRPFPPKSDPPAPWSLHYGECVDMLYEDAWWEGVIIDHEDGCEKRRVFFPDMGDEMEAQIDKLRLTQVWDEVADKWKCRGNWLFLELIEEFERDWLLPVSVKQIWYEVRVKNGFERLKEWTSSVQSAWRELVYEVLSDNYKITIKHFFKELSFCGEFSESVLDAVFKTEGLVPSSLAVVPFKAAPPSDNKEIAPNQSVEQDNLANEQALCVAAPALPILSQTPDQDSGIGSYSYNKGATGTTLKMPRVKSTQRNKLQWLPAVPHLVPASEFCPDAITKFSDFYRLNKRAPAEVILNARKHLLHLGWMMEYAVDKLANRVRYFSPDGDLFYSLTQACQKLEQADQEPGPKLLMLSMSPNDSKRSAVTSPDDVISSALMEKSQPSSELSNSRNPSEEVIIEAENCPEAVKEYYLLSLEDRDFSSVSSKDKKLKALKAKKHLSYSGWSFCCFPKGVKREMRYYSPSGMVFYSLLSACRWCVESGGLSPSGDSPIIRGSGSAGVVLDLGSPLPLIALEAQGNYPNGKFEKLPNESSKLSMTKGLVRSMKMKVKKARNLQKRKNLNKICHSEGSIWLKRGRKPRASMRLNGNMNADSSTPCGKPREVVASSRQTPRTILSWLIDNNVVLPRAKVQYRGRKDGRPMAEGRITREGIKCSCCQKVYSLSRFEAHAGSTNHRPSANIFLEDGRSLLDCQSQVTMPKSNGRSRSESKKKTGSQCNKTNDYVCSVCQYGGELVLCDQCPSSFHTQCLGLEEVPDGDWFCPSCCCGICGQCGFDRTSEQFIDSSVLTCGQCEHQYHVGCLKKKGILDLDCHPEGHWFCQDSCEQIYRGLCNILGKPIPLGNENLTWTLVKYMKKDSCDYDTSDNELMVENYSKLNVALSVMHECFKPLKVPDTGRDLVEDVIFSRWSALNRLNFQGFYTVLLEKNDELVSAVTVRIYGKKVAEIPLVATRQQYRRLGMCRILINALEQKLMELGVERLVLPSVRGLLQTWTTSFGFSVMNESERLSFLDYTFLDFPDTVFCQKVLTHNPSSVSSLSTGTQEKSCDQVKKCANTELDGNSAMSEISQAEGIDETDIAEQGSTCIERGGTDNTGALSGNGSAELSIMVDQPTIRNCLPFENRISLESSIATTDDNQLEDKNNDGIFKCYKRRRISAC